MEEEEEGREGERERERERGRLRRQEGGKVIRREERSSLWRKGSKGWLQGGEGGILLY